MVREVGRAGVTCTLSYTVLGHVYASRVISLWGSNPAAPVTVTTAGYSPGEWLIGCPHHAHVTAGLGQSERAGSRQGMSGQAGSAPVSSPTCCINLALA